MKEYFQSKAAKIWVGENGATKIQNRGQVPERILKEMQAWIKDNHKAMERKWNAYGGGGFYIEVDKI